MRLLLTDRADHAVDLISSCVCFILRQAMEKHRNFLKNIVDCVVKLEEEMAKITGRNYSKLFSVKRFTLT